MFFSWALRGYLVFSYLWSFFFFLNTLNLSSSFPFLMFQFKSNYFLDAFLHQRSYLFLPPLISLSIYELFGDWHLLTWIVILTCISKAKYFGVEREIKVHLVHQTSEVGLSSESFQPTCQINFTWIASLTESSVSFD